MSHPLARYCSERLENGVEALPPQQKKVRAGVGEFLSNMRLGGARDVVRRFRQLSQFMRLDRERWPRALDRLFSMGYPQAEETVTKYRRWVARLKCTNSHKQHMNAWGFVLLSRTLKKRGLLAWELKHVATQAREQRWKGCPEGFRVKMEEWLRIEQARNLRPKSMLLLREELLRFGDWLRSMRLPFLSVDRSDALTWLESIRARDLAPCTFNHRLSIAKRFYSWLVVEETLGKSPFEHLGFMKVSRKLPKTLEERDVARLLRGARAGCDKAVLEVMYSSGCRVGELCALDLKQVSLTEKTARTVGKGGHDRMLYLNDSAVRAIKAYLPRRALLSKKAHPQDQGALFFNSSGTRFNWTSVRMILRRALMKSELGKHVSPHMIRHAFATHMLNRGADIFSIMQFMGHQDIQSTIRYLQVATARLSEVLRKFHPRK